MGTSPVGVAIIGGGASGALVAAHLLRGASSPSRIALIERDGRKGEGIAYSTGSECHLLNVPARSMSAFEDDPEHFVRWLATQGLPAAAGTLALQVRLPVRARPYAWNTGWLVNCTGTDPNLVRRGEPLLEALVARGLARPGPLGTGLATDHRGRARDLHGRPSDWLWAIGPLRQGDLLESTAIPEIRVQARHLAIDIERSLAARGTNPSGAPTETSPGPKNRPPSAQLLAS